jgi:ribokinase
VDALHALGARSVLVTLGADGVLMSERGGTRTRHNAYVAHAVDTSGAGDAFIGALGASLVEGIALGQAIDRAQRAASISVTRHGAMASLPFRNELGIE